MILTINPTAQEAIYLQIRNQIILGIADGKLTLNESLPSVRQMAEQIGVNMMTVSKAYNLLKEEGYIEIDRRHGAKVKGHLQNESQFEKKMTNELRLILAEAKIRGVDMDNLDQLFRTIFYNFSFK